MSLKEYFRTNSSARRVRECINWFFSFGATPHKAIFRLTEELELTQVFDIGANSGQFAIDLRRAGYVGEIYSIEPGERAFSKLQKKSKRDPLWHPLKLALGSKEQTLILNISQNSGLSSSFLQMNELHLENFPDSKFVSQESVHVKTLSALISELNLNPTNLLLKLDVQGFEKEVLIGAGNLLPIISVCYLEISLSSLYDGESDLLQVINFLADSGHYVVDIYRGVTGKNGSLLQVDVLTRNTRN